MFGIGMPELFVIMAIALIVIGPKKLPDLARTIGRALGEFKKATGELKTSLGVDEELSDIRHAFDDINQDIRDAVNVDLATPAENEPASVDSPENPLEKEDVTPEDNPETMDDRVSPESKPADMEATAADINDVETAKAAGRHSDQGETAGDK
ncbi:MAG: twin-arginine translocase TatA/TatE family subunit [Deltaproteobacteria bacterium]|nr:MAG: twin-arginine translocase TatA/TatE family subunit [Deltaproteobacteria bacterium]